jgi:hypothetical protein
LRGFRGQDKLTCAAHGMLDVGQLRHTSRLLQ